jgi:hypothetical protein
MRSRGGPEQCSYQGFSLYEYALLRFRGIFHVDKNTNVGLGKRDIWEKGE